MFETIDAAELNMPMGLLAEGQRAWQFVNYRLHMHWFYMLYKTEFEGDSMSSDFALLTSEDQIVEMASFDHVEIIDIYFVSPGHLNGSDRWKMEKLKEIWTSKIKNDKSGINGMIYVLQDDKEYRRHAYNDKTEELIKDKLLVKI